jgi:RimJ/RimL family protein N-acetyltransferase
MCQVPTSQEPESADAGQPAVSLGDLELLRIETALLWDLDRLGRIRGPVEFAVGIAGDGVTAAVGQDVPDDVALRVLARATSAAPPQPGESPSFLRACREMLTAGQLGDLALSGGPSYYVEPPICFASNARVLRSDSPYVDEVLSRRPDVWEPDEWIDLIRGGAGAPWAMVLQEDRVASICHTPGRTTMAAEAGTWTAPEFRGRGYAAATTAAWADLFSPHCPYLFYCTSAENYSSQHVAQRLGLRPIGWTWKLTRAPATEQPA